MAPTSRSLIAYLFLLLPTAFWGSNVVIARALIQDMPPMGLILARWTLALAILIPIGGPSLWRQRHIVRAHWRMLTLLGVLGIAGFNTLVYVALSYTTAVNATLIQGGIPVTVVCLSWLVLRERIRLRMFAAMALSFLGMATIVFRGDIHHIFQVHLNHGDILVAGAIWIWGLYIILVNRRPSELSSAAFLLYIVIVGEIVIVLVALTGLGGNPAFDLTPARAAGIVYIAAFPSVLAYYLWNRGIELVGANVGAQFQYLLPAFGSLFAVLFLGEPFEFYHGVGTALIFGGIYLATSSRR